MRKLDDIEQSIMDKWERQTESMREKYEKDLAKTNSRYRDVLHQYRRDIKPFPDLVKLIKI